MSGLYTDATAYDSHAATYRADIPFYLNLARRSGGPALELGCGTGRLAIPMARAGIAVTGVDRAPAMLERARAGGVSGNRWILSDCRSLDLGETFPFVFAAFNVLQEQLEDSDLTALFSTVTRHLAPDGTFAFDVPNPSGTGWDRPMRGRWEAAKRGLKKAFGSALGWELRHRTVSFQAESGRGLICWERLGRSPARVEAPFRGLTPQELDRRLGEAGLMVIARWGGFSGERFTRLSLRQVVVAEKARAAG